ncbi:DUF6464 family protein [Pannus brasiliensis CCIBt3594]|uniref:DUF6464 family protein n=1 Tax=Pannus brasiliensis CCIBt3594 TaxID=1427578 RepID=A0AAW9QN05_9CHRO
MFAIAVIAFLAVVPSLIGLWLIQASRRRFQERLTRIRERSRFDPVAVGDSLSMALDSSERPPFIGDRTCFYNALSPYLRCAVNPDGPCESCSRYENRASRVAAFLSVHAPDRS